MDSKLRRFQKVRNLVLGAATLPATLALSWFPVPAFAQSATTQTQGTAMQDRQQDRQAAPADDITRRDLARFDQFLDSHHEIAAELRKTPSLIDDPQFLQNHPELNSYLQDHPSVKQEISQQPDTFMSLEDRYDHDHGLRDRDAGGQYRDDRDAGRRDAMNQDRDSSQDRDANHRDADRRDATSFNRFLEEHREISEQVRKNPSLLDDRKFVDGHPALQSYLRDNPGVRDQLRQDPNAFMHQQDFDNRDAGMRARDTGNQDRDDRNAVSRDAVNQDRDADRNRDRDAANQDRDANRNRDNDRQNDADRRDNDSRADMDRNSDRDRDADHRDAARFDRFLDEHREIGEQVRRNPSLLDNRNFVDSHPALQSYLRDNPDIREQLRQDPNAFTRQSEFGNRDAGMRDRDPMHEHMADFGGFLGSHSDIRNDMQRDPSVVKDRAYVQNHSELDTYLNTHPAVRNDLMADPQSFVHGAQQYNNSGAAGAGMSGRGTGTTGTSSGTSTTPAVTPHSQKPNQ